MSSTSFSPELWGPPAWEFMHYCALAYPSRPTMDQKNKYLTFFTLLGDVLPCDTCKSNFKTHLQQYPLENYLANNKTLFAWTMLVRNEIRRANGVSKMLSHQEVYDKLVNKCKSSPWYYYAAPVAIIGTLLITK